MDIILGNILGFISSIIMVYTGLIKEKNKFLIVQIIQMIIAILSNFVLGGFTGAIINGINCIRNILCYKEKLNIKNKILLLLIAIILSLSFNNLGIIGLLPLISTIVYTFFLSIKDVRKLKFVIVFTTSLWLVHDFVVMAYTTCVFDFLTIITNIISIYQLSKKVHKN